MGAVDKVDHAVHSLSVNEKTQWPESFMCQWLPVPGVMILAKTQTSLASHFSLERDREQHCRIMRQDEGQESNRADLSQEGAP